MQRILRPFALVALPLTIASLGLFACSKADARAPKNIVLVSVDTLRADHLGCYGAKGDPTPNIDRLAARGARFEKAWSAVPVTTPSHATLMTGTFPPFNGVRSNGSYSIAEDRTTLAEAMKKKGYETAGFVGAFPLDHQFGFAQGFDVYDDDIKRAEQSLTPYDAERRAGTVVDRALAWLKGRDAKKPFFLFVHVYDPHQPYNPPEPQKTKYAADPYTGEVAYVDQELGRLFGQLAEQKLDDDTLVVLLADHGESLGEHGEATHMIFVYDATLRVPLLMAGPGIPKGKVVPEPARLVDLFPSLATMVGAEIPKEVQGVDLSPALAGKGLDDKRPFYAESLLPQVQFDWAPLQSVRHGKWKYILAPREELYDVDADPGELRNLLRRGEDGRPAFDAPEQESAYRNLSHELRKAIADLSSPEAAKATKVLDGEAAKKLQSLGYMGSIGASSSTDGVDPMKLPDPKDRIEVFNRTEEALHLVAIGQTEEALGIYRKLAKENPKESWIQTTLARNLMALQRHKEVLDVLTPEVMASFSKANRATALSLRAGALEEGKRWDEAIKEWDALAAIGSREAAVGAARGKANALVELRKWDEAAKLLEPIVAADPADREGRLILGYAQLGLGKESAGLARLGEAQALEPKGADGKPDPKSAPLLRAANYYMKIGEKGKAATALRALIAADPSQAGGETGYLLSTLGAASGDANAQRLEASRRKSAAGDFAGALADLEAVVAAGGDGAAVQYDIAVCNFNLGKAQEAGNALIKCMKADSRFVPCFADFGLLLDRSGEKEKAERYYRRALDLEPTHYEALSRFGIFLARAKRLPEAITMLERAVAANPKSADARHNLAIALKNAGREADAEKAEAEARRLQQQGAR